FQGISARPASASMSARPPRPPGSAPAVRPDRPRATSRAAAPAAAASYASASVWYTSSCMAADRSGTSGREPSITLTIAGSDPSGGAGIQADLKTFLAFHTYGAAVITALTVQNTRGVRAVHPVPPDVVVAQL